MLNKLETVLARYIRYWSGAYTVIVLLLTLAALYTLSVSFWRGPWRDMWEALPFVEKAMAGQASLFDYWDQYGYSHRPLISRLFWVADFRWFAGSNQLLLAVSLLMQAMTYCSLRSVLRRDSSFSAHERRIVLTGVLFCLLNITQVFNLLHTFDVQWFLVTGFVVLSLERILANMHRQNPAWLLFAWLCVFLATLNNFSALVIWPVEILLLLALRYPPAQIAIYFLATIFYLLLYFYGLPTNGDSLIGEIAHQPLPQVLQAIAGLLVVFPLWYLSNPLSFQLATDGPLHMSWPVNWIAPLLVASLLVCALWCWWQGLWQRKRYSAIAWLGLSMVLYGYGVGVVTALGRAVFWENVYALRYQNIVLLFWIGIVLWLASSVRWRHAGLFAGAVLLLLVFTFNIGWNHDNLIKTGNRTRDAHLALLVGLEKELSAIRATVSRSHLGEGSTYTLQQEAQFLRSIHAGPYADPAWQVPDFKTVENSPACAVSASGLDVRGDNGRYARLSVDFAKPAQYSYLVWFDDDNTAPGLLIATRADTFWQRWQQSLNGFTAYAGFAKQLPTQEPDNIFARQGDQWCRLVLE
jgi:hypothetical protein